MLPSWNNLEKAAFQYFFGLSRKFVSVPSVTDEFSDYSVVSLKSYVEAF